jgi:hypothetical protein
MNTSLVKSTPQGDFAEVSVLMRDWQMKFEALLSQNRPIKIDVYPIPNVLPSIYQRLDQHGYSDVVVENDRWQHFLVPDSN